LKKIRQKFIIAQPNNKKNKFMEYIHFRTGIPGIIPPDCSELIPPPPNSQDEPIVHGPQQTREGVVNKVINGV
jgi:hypothetical protein